MNTAVRPSIARVRSLPLLTVVTVLAVVLAWFLRTKAHFLFDYSPASYTDYWPRRFGLVLHLAGGLTAIVTGLIQIWLGLTQRVNTPHRVLGKVYAAGVLIGSIGGFYLAFTIHGAVAYSAGLISLDVAWLITTGMALYAIRLRRIQQHRDWMLRSYTVTFAFVTFRIFSMWLHRWIDVADDPVADNIDVMMAWASWAVPLLLAEPLIQLRAMRRTTI